MPLIRTMIDTRAAVSMKEAQIEDALFLRLQDVAAPHHDVYSCSVQGADSTFIVILSDPDSGKELCAWSGSPDAVILEFQRWLERRHVGAHEAE